MSWTVEKEWVSKEGLRCVITRGGFNYHRCGYVAVTKEHPLYGVDYSKPTTVLKKMWDKVKDGELGKRGVIPCLLINDDEDPRPDVVFDVHGSLTFSGEGRQVDGSYYPAPGDDLWWFGFDCAHYMDDHEGGQPLDYVVAECESLAAQLMQV